MNPTYCRHLRTKKLYTGTPAEELFVKPEEENASPCHYWCNLTQTVAGPDDRPANRTACNPSRPCFEE